MAFSTSAYLIAHPHDLDIKLVVTPGNILADLNSQMVYVLLRSINKLNLLLNGFHFLEILFKYFYFCCINLIYNRYFKIAL